MELSWGIKRYRRTRLLLSGMSKKLSKFPEAAMAAELTRGQRLKIMLTREEVEALDNWRFERRMPSRAAAIRELLKRGLSSDGFNTVEPGSHSRDSGVLGDSSEAPTREREQQAMQ